jgi:hypothetical protein
LAGDLDGAIAAQAALLYDCTRFVGRDHSYSNDVRTTLREWMNQSSTGGV